MKIIAVNTIVYCDRWEETVTFYRDGLRLPVLSHTDWFVEFKLNESARLSVANAARTSVKSGGGKGITISLQINEIESFQAELVAAGIGTSPIKEVWGSKVLYVHDPEGNRLEFWEGMARV